MVHQEVPTGLSSGERPGKEEKDGRKLSKGGLMEYPRPCTFKELKAYLEQRMDDRAAADEDELETYKRDELYEIRGW